jgi:hypothetical protein
MTRPTYGVPLNGNVTVVLLDVYLQLNTTHWRARALAKSFVVSVLPVPAGLSAHMSDMGSHCLSGMLMSTSYYNCRSRAGSNLVQVLVQ